MAPKWHSEKIMHQQPVETQADRVRNRHEDRGYTLVEMLVAIVLMGTIVLSIMGGMWAVVRASSQNNDRAKVQAVLGSAADRISVLTHNNCPEESGVYEAFGAKAAASVGWPASSVKIIDYQYWDGSAWAENCNLTAGLTVKRTLQKLTIRATAPGSGFSAQLEIIKSDIRPEEVPNVIP